MFLNNTGRNNRTSLRPLGNFRANRRFPRNRCPSSTETNTRTSHHPTCNCQARRNFRRNRCLYNIGRSNRKSPRRFYTLDASARQTRSRNSTRALPQLIISMESPRIRNGELKIENRRFWVYIFLFILCPDWDSCALRPRK
jgi:hypothetical protein